MLFCLALCCVLTVSCSTGRKAYRTDKLLVKNKVVVTDDNDDVSSNSLLNYVTPQPNTKFLDVLRIKLFAYELGRQIKRDTKFKKWLMYTVGEPPVYADSSKYHRTVEQLHQEVANRGYYNPEITFQEKQKGDDRVVVTYNVKLNSPYVYSRVDNSIDDTTINAIAYSKRSPSLIQQGNIFNAYTLDEERGRIAGLLRNRGYYLFSKDLIEYRVDTTFDDDSVTIKLLLNNPIVKNEDDNETVDLHKYYIRNVNVYSNFDPNVDYSKPSENDISVTMLPADTMFDTKGKFYFYDVGKQKLRTDVLQNALYVRPGMTYSSNGVNFSNRSLINIPAVRYANISFVPVTNYVDSLLDCHVRITRKKLHAPSVSTEVTNNGGRLGFGLNVNYDNRNIFRGGESFRISTLGSIELQFGKKSSVNTKNLIHTAHVGVTLSLFMPRIAAPFFSHLPGYYFPKTNVDLGFSYQHRTELYERIISNVSLGYSWRKGRRITNILEPIDFNYVKINTQQLFEKYLAQMRGTIYKSQYTSHTLLGLNYTFTYSNQDEKVKRGTFFAFRGNLQSSGNVLNGVSMTKLGRKDSLNVYNFLGVPYAQFVLCDLEFKTYKYFDEKNVLVLRLETGVGFPYNNSVALPVEKAFYGGGANDMRGWGLKMLGPGSYNGDLNIERVADISLKANVEYRFPVYKIFRMALFVDAGNVWLWNEDEDFVGGNFQFNRFYKEIALDAGVGFRLDFNFAVIRLDVGAPIINPSLPAGHRYTSFSFKNMIWNIGIGYPF